MTRSVVLAWVLAVACGAPGPNPPNSTTSRVVTAPSLPRRADTAAVRLDAAPVPPVAARISHAVVSPHGTRDDPYYWLRDDTRSRRDVLDYLAAENAYAAAMLAPAQPLEDAITAETRARIDEASVGPAILEDGYWYYTRYAAGQQRPIYARRKGVMTAPEEILLDANALAADKPFFAVGDHAVSHDGTLLAWTDDTVGRNQFTLHVRNLATGALLADTASGIAPSVAWANDNQTVFYVGKDATTLREDRVMRHPLGGAHELVYQERDAAFYVDIAPTKSRRYLRVELDATTQSETRLVDLDHPATAARTLIPRTRDHIYEVDHVGTRGAGRFVVRTNDHAKNFRLVEVPARHPERRASWKELVPHRADALLEEFVLYETFVALGVRIGGLARIEVMAGKRPRVTLEGSDPAFAMTLVDTPDPRATTVRYTYDSLTTPTTTFEQDVATGTRTVVHRDPAPTYDPTRYASEYLHAAAPDGTQIPISVVYRKDTPRDGTAPLLVTGYGAYGESLEPTFERVRISLLDRGWVFAIAHVRGGEELGVPWYDAGRLLAKQNTFTDFIAATEYLIAQKVAARDRVFAEGASAGGLLVGAIANMRPDLYRGLIAWVPFVDAVTTMLDDSIPLVTNEYDEWGDPHDKAAYDYMLAYSPYDNVRAQAYPAMYVRTGLFDSQVQYYEPAKWVAKLRATKTDGNLLLLETDMAAGHEGKSGRFDAIREWARAYAFIVHVNGDAGGAR